MTRTINRGNIYIRKLIPINKSLGVILPSKFVKKLGLIPGELIKLELAENDESIVVEKIRRK